MCFCSCDIIARSVSFDKKDRLLTGLKFECISSIPVFLRSGVTRAVFHSVGKCPIINDEFTIFEIVGSKQSMQSFSNHVGKGSAGDCLLGEAIMSLCKSIFGRLRKALRLSLAT
jgi:hypothetical protein